MYNETKEEDIIITNTQVFEEFIVEEFLGFITVTVVRGLNFVTDASATLNTLLGGRNKAIEDIVELAFNETLALVRKKAKKLKADAVINLILSHNFEEFNFCGTLLVVVAEGVAVELIRRPEAIQTLAEARQIEREEGLIG